jgi:hypothetical protein
MSRAGGPQGGGWRFPVAARAVARLALIGSSVSLAQASQAAALSLRQPEKNQYTHRLEGIDPTWVITGTDSRRATYTGIPHGCRFREKARIRPVLTPPASRAFFSSLLAVLLVARSLPELLEHCQRPPDEDEMHASTGAQQSQHL